MNVISEFDQKVSLWIKNHLHNQKLSWILSRVNRGEVLALFILPLVFLSDIYKPLSISLPLILVFSYLTDRFVLYLKKTFSRKRPLVSVMGKVDSNPDMKHSFPSAHSANSMVVVTILIFGYGESSLCFLFTLFAGLGRLITLHHYISDVFGGWILGFITGVGGIIILKIIQFYFA